VCSFEELATTAQLFYADDGVIADNEPVKVQKVAEECTELELV
jgi:hypothetical protein